MKYGHRNGHAYCPTESGWYWFEGWAKDDPPCFYDLILYVSVEPGYPSLVWRGDGNRNIAELDGRWWGPMQKPLGADGNGGDQ